MQQKPQRKILLTYQCWQVALSKKMQYRTNWHMEPIYTCSENRKKETNSGSTEKKGWLKVTHQKTHWHVSLIQTCSENTSNTQQNTQCKNVDANLWLRSRYALIGRTSVILTCGLYSEKKKKVNTQTYGLICSYSANSHICTLIHNKLCQVN